MSEKIRINRFLASAGLDSRRKCEELIRKGKVFVNGEQVHELTYLVDPEHDSVTIDGRRIEPNADTVVLVLNKPPGVLSAVVDSFQRKTVIDLARERGHSGRLFPIGRLDQDTSGIILITNDGDLAYRLTHPKYKIEKTYRVIVEGNVSPGTASKIAAGIKTKDFVTWPCTVEIENRSVGRTELTVKLKEGRKRQIRRMFMSFGHRVVALERIAIGDLRFVDVAPGEIRPLTKREEDRLRQLTGLLP
jgi:23S rRNA pseudouridine2605 synthase